MLQRSLHVFDAVRLDHVVHLDVIVAGNLEAALEALADFAGIVLEAFERLEAGRAIRWRVDDHAAADEANLRRTLDRALRDVATGDRADAADLERLADDGASQVHDFLARLQLAFEGGANVVGQVVDD